MSKIVKSVYKISPCNLNSFCRVQKTPIVEQENRGKIGPGKYPLT